MTDFVEYGEGEVVYAIGGPQKWLWGLEKGQVQVRLALIEAEPMLGHMFQFGSWFGESELIQGTDGLIEVTATMPTRLRRGKSWFSAVLRSLMNMG